MQIFDNVTILTYKKNFKGILHVEVVRFMACSYEDRNILDVFQTILQHRNR